MRGEERTQWGCLYTPPRAQPWIPGLVGNKGVTDDQAPRQNICEYVLSPPCSGQGVLAGPVVGFTADD